MFVWWYVYSQIRCVCLVVRIQLTRVCLFGGTYTVNLVVFVWWYVYSQLGYVCLVVRIQSTWLCLFGGTYTVN